MFILFVVSPFSFCFYHAYAARVVSIFALLNQWACTHMNQTGETYFPKSKCPSHGLNLLLLGHGNCMLLSSRAWSEGELLKHFRSFVCFSFFFHNARHWTCFLGCGVICCCPSFDSLTAPLNTKWSCGHSYIEKTTMNQKKNLGIKGFVYKRYSFGSKFLRVWPSLPFPFCVPKFRCHDWIVKKTTVPGAVGRQPTCGSSKGQGSSCSWARSKPQVLRCSTGMYWMYYYSFFFQQFVISSDFVTLVFLSKILEILLGQCSMFVWWQLKFDLRPGWDSEWNFDSGTYTSCGQRWRWLQLQGTRVMVWSWPGAKGIRWHGDFSSVRSSQMDPDMKVNGKMDWSMARRVGELQRGGIDIKSHVMEIEESLYKKEPKVIIFNLSMTLHDLNLTWTKNHLPGSLHIPRRRCLWWPLPWTLSAINSSIFQKWLCGGIRKIEVDSGV